MHLFEINNIGKGLIKKNEERLLVVLVVLGVGGGGDSEPQNIADK